MVRIIPIGKLITMHIVIVHSLVLGDHGASCSEATGLDSVYLAEVDYTQGQLISTNDSMIDAVHFKTEWRVLSGWGGGVSQQFCAKCEGMEKHVGYS